MTTLSGIESFVRSAEAGSFSAAARRLELTPAAVSKNVAKLEEALGVRLFHRSTRKLALTEPGEHFLREVGGGLAAIQGAITAASGQRREPAGTLRVSMAPGFGHRFLLAPLSEFLRRHPHVRGDWHLDHHAVDLVGGGFDAAIGGGFDLAPGLIARELVRVHVVAVAAPAYLEGKKPPRSPDDLAAHDGISQRSGSTGRIMGYVLRDRGGRTSSTLFRTRVAVSDPESAVTCAEQGLGLALVPIGFIRAQLERGTLVRVLPGWWHDFGAISIYYASARHQPAKTRAFIDFLLAHVKRERLSERFLAT